jgi:PAT family beta-lactamase induction signal transducer AmpG
VSPWRWIPSLYLAQGLPNAVVITLSMVMFKRLGISNAEIALYTGWLHLPWVIKPLWSPLVEMARAKRWWIIAMQLLVGAGMAGVALSLPGPGAFRYALAFLWLLAFGSATHDIAADGFYMLGLSTRQQAFFVGWRNTFFRVALLSGQGLLVMLAGYLEKRFASTLPEAIATPRAWSVIFGLLAAAFLLLALYHAATLPRPAADRPAARGSARAFLETFTTFFRKRGIVPALAFLLLFRLAEAQLAKVASPFLLDDPGRGGLGMTTAAYGLAYGTVGLVALVVGGIAGGMTLARRGFRRSAGWMAVAMNLPNLVYLYLALARPASTWVITPCVAIEQFGYGYGFTAFTFFMILFSNGPSKTAHYAICTGFMALGLMLPGMVSGWIQELLGYPAFFLWIMLCTIPSFAVTRIASRLTS